MRRWLVAIVLAGLLAGCGGDPDYRILGTKSQADYVEVSVLTRTETAAGVQRVIEATVARTRRQLHARHVTVYVLDTPIYIGVVYDVAVAYWEAADGKLTVYLREKVRNPGSLVRPSDDELSYFGIQHRLTLGRPDLVSPTEASFYQRFLGGHSDAELADITLRVMRWLYQ